MEIFLYKTEDFHLMYVWLNWWQPKIIYKIEDFFWKKLKYNDSHSNIIRIQLKKEVETFYDRTEDFHLTYAW